MGSALCITKLVHKMLFVQIAKENCMESGMPVSQKIEEPRVKKISRTRYLLFVSWTLIAIGVSIVIWNLLLTPEFHSGTNISFKTDINYFLVVAGTGPITVYAESPDFFLLRNDLGEYVIGIPKPPPLNWDSPKYFKSDPKIISPGNWTVAMGDTKLYFSSPETMSVTQVMTDYQFSGSVFLLILFGLAIWAFVTFAMILKKK
jgi:hypothetical protein